MFRSDMPQPREHRYRPNSLMSQAIAKLAEHESLTVKDFQRVVLEVCETKDQANNLIFEMRRRGLTERRVVFTDRLRRAAKSVL